MIGYEKKIGNLEFDLSLNWRYFGLGFTISRGIFVNSFCLTFLFLDLLVTHYKNFP